MKQISRLMVLAMAVVMCLSLASVAFAAPVPYSNQDSYYNFSCSFLNFNATTDSRPKENSTSIYVWVEKSNEAWVRVQAQGSLRSSGTSWNNYTELGDRSGVEYVFVSTGDEPDYQRLIYNGIHEANMGYARLAFRARNVWGDSISGRWSPDSVGTFPHATNREP